MEPNYPPQPGQPPQSGQYDFITTPPKSPKKGLFGIGSSGKNGLLIIIAGGLGLFTLILLVGSLFFGGSSDKEALLGVAKKQSEVIAVAELGAEEGGTNQAQSLGLAVKLAVTSEQQEIIAELTKKGKIKDKEYAAVPSAAVTTELETAQRNGRFDEVFNNVIRQELTEYQQELRAANNTVSGKTAKELLAKDFDSVALLLTIPGN